MCWLGNMMDGTLNVEALRVSYPELGKTATVKSLAKHAKRTLDG